MKIVQFNPDYLKQMAALFVEAYSEKNRQKGIGKVLLKYVVETASKNGIKVADKRKDFLQSWYHKLGFVETGWVEFEADVNELDF